MLNKKFNAVLSAVKYIYHNPLQALAILLALQEKVVKGFNQKTILNTYEYLDDYFTAVSANISENPSGFYRMPLLSESVVSVIDCDKFRMNYWPSAEGPQIINKDETTHDHPNPFKTYVMSGGYTHSLYSLPEDEERVRVKCPPGSLIDDPDQEEFYHYQLSANKSDLVRHSPVKLKKICEVEVGAGTMDLYDDQLIHRVTHQQPGTLSMNCVSLQGKGRTNFYFTEDKSENFKKNLTKLNPEKGMEMVDNIKVILQHGLFGRIAENKGLNMEVTGNCC